MRCRCCYWCCAHHFPLCTALCRTLTSRACCGGGGGDCAIPAMQLAKLGAAEARCARESARASALLRLCTCLRERHVCMRSLCMRCTCRIFCVTCCCSGGRPSCSVSSNGSSGGETTWARGDGMTHGSTSAGGPCAKSSTTSTSTTASTSSGSSAASSVPSVCALLPAFGCF